MKQVEHGLQVGVARLLDLCLDPERTWWSAIDHAAKLSARYGADRKRRGVKPGMPDIIIMPEYKPIVGIELKSATGGMTPPQLATQRKWLRMGHLIYVARSLEEVQKILERENIPLKRKMFVGAS